MRQLVVTLVMALLLCFGVVSAQALDVPKNIGYVNDYAGMFSKKQSRDLDQMLEQYEDDTSNQIMILTIDSLEGAVLESFSIAVAEKWEIGQEDKDNGILILIAKKDRKMRIEVGYGLEGALPDISAGRITKYILTPQFKEEKFFEGIQEAVQAIQSAIKGEFDSDALVKKAKDKETLEFLGILFVGVFLLAAFFGIFSPWLGALCGALGAPCAVVFLYGMTMMGVVIAAIIGGIVGFIARPAAEVGIQVGLSGSSSGGGGFGGGGGGGFGGGGASGSW